MIDAAEPSGLHRHVPDPGLPGVVAALGADFRAGRAHPRQAAEAALELLAEVEPQLNAFALVMAETALAEADRAGAELAAGRDLGPLHGIPVAVKDLIDIAGLPTGCGTRAMTPAAAAADAPLVARLRAAGAVILGKTNLLEFAYGVAHPEIGQTNNPHDPARTSGGSSGGSAAAVAAGVVPLAVGTDTGGSIRVPAGYCGIVGLKPTYGLVPVDGVYPLSWTLDHVGPMARSVADAAALLAVLSGRAVPLEALRLPGLRLGVLRQLFPAAPANAAVGATVEAALDRLTAAGCTLTEVTLPDLPQAPSALLAIVLAEAAVIHRELHARNPGGYAPRTRQQIEAGLALPATELVRALRLRDRLRGQVDAALADVDLLVSPAVCQVAPDEEPPLDIDVDPEIKATGPFNLTGHPALSLPCGAVGGLPVGLQLVARHGADARLLSCARAVETLLQSPE